MKRRELLALAPVALWSGCASEPVKKEEKPAEPVTGLHALYQMYARARTWSLDLKVIRMAGIDIAQVAKQPGKAAAWQAVFASETLQQKRSYLFSVFDASVSLRAGTFPEPASQWSPDGRAFLIAAVKTDTDVALETALKHGEKYAKANPSMPITFTLDMGRALNSPAWRVIWGESASSSAFSVLIDASTGAYLDTLY